MRHCSHLPSKCDITHNIFIGTVVRTITILGTIPYSIKLILDWVNAEILTLVIVKTNLDTTTLCQNSECHISKQVIRLIFKRYILLKSIHLQECQPNQLPYLISCNTMFLKIYIPSFNPLMQIFLCIFTTIIISRLCGTICFALLLYITT